MVNAIAIAIANNPVKVSEIFLVFVIICPIFFFFRISFCPTKCDLSGTGGASGANFLQPWGQSSPTEAKTV